MRRPDSSGSAHTGLMEWLLQRVSSLYMAGFVVYAIVYFGLQPVRDHAAWQAWFALGSVRILWAIFIFSLLLHAWIGMRSIFMDYIHPLWIRFSLSLITAFGLLALGLWAAQILLAVAA